MRLLIPLVLALAALPALAQEVEAPRTRPAPDVEAIAPLPRPRPAERPPETPEAPKPAEEKAAEPEAATKPEAAPKPPRTYQTACPALILGLVEARPLPPIAEEGCGEHSPLALTGVLVNGRMVPLSGEALVNCEMAMTLPAWAAAVDGFAFAQENSRLKSITVGTSYMCRARRTGAETADLSEHAFANALDVTGFVLEDGRSLGVESGWGRDADGGRLLRFAHDAACARFMTTLGPEANALHKDHLHLDQGCHGKTCSARLCE